MGIAYTTQVLHHSTLGNGQRMILMVIADHHGETGAWCSIQTIADQSGCSTRTVQRAIVAAEAAGELTRDVNAGGLPGVRRDRRPNLYQITIDCPDTCQGGPAHRRRPEPVPPTRTPVPVDNPPRGDSDVTPPGPRGDNHDTHGVTTLSPEPSVEPSEDLLPSVSPETTDRARTETTDGQTTILNETNSRTNSSRIGPEPVDPRLADPDFLRFLATVAPGIRRPDRFDWPPAELDALEARWLSPDPFTPPHGDRAPPKPTPQPPRLDLASLRPANPVPPPPNLRDHLRRSPT